MRKLLYSLAFSLFLVALSLVIAQQRHLVFADTSSGESVALSGITFPIAQLNNCANRDACRTYCDQTDHINACIAFAKAHGLLSQEEETKSQKFAQLLQSGGGPGGCTSPEACRAFCSTIQNIPACVSFAKEHGFKDDDLSRAQKIQQFIQSGGTMPGGCTSKDSCEAYCSDFSHAEECLAFAKKVGITDIENLGQQKIPSGQFQKFLELVKEHKTPGQCTDAQSCQTFCQDKDHHDECISFAKDAGFLSSEQADNIEKLGGKGPGGCDSEDSCKTFCNDAAHQQECLQFAKDHDLISQDEERDSQDALLRLREGLSNAPQEVQQCLSSTLGQQTVQDIEAGNVLPSPNIGEQVRACFEHFGERENPDDAIKQLNKGVSSCVKEKVGDILDQIKEGKASATPELADQIRACSQLQSIDNENGNDANDLLENVRNTLRIAPPDVRACLEAHQSKLSEHASSDTIKSIVNQCFQGIKPMGIIGIPTPGQKEEQQPAQSSPTASQPAMVPIPAENFVVEADDSSATPEKIVAQKGAEVTITFKVSPTNTYHGGLEFRSDVVSSAPISPGSSQDLHFTADKGFDFIPYWPSTNIQKPYKIEVEVEG